MPLKIPFQTVLDALLDESKPFPATYLKEFSDISPENLNSLMKIWPVILPKRKLTLMEDLEDMAVTDTLTSFEDLARPLFQRLLSLTPGSRRSGSYGKRKIKS